MTSDNELKINKIKTGVIAIKFCPQELNYGLTKLEKIKKPSGRMGKAGDLRGVTSRSTKKTTRKGL